MNLKQFSVILLLLSCVGCSQQVSDLEKFLADPNGELPAKQMVVGASPDVQIIVDSMKDVSKDDVIVMRKLFVGLQQYLANGKKLDNTIKVFKVIKDFEEDYGYSKGKYVAYTDAVEKFLKDKGYSKPKKIIDSEPKENEVSRAQIISDLSVLADAAKIRMNANE